MPKTILLADNHAELLEVRKLFLEDEGYTVLTATSPETAQQALETEWLHLAILDIRLQDDRDTYDISGLKLAMDPAFQHIPKIILTNYPNYEYVRNALRPGDAPLPPAVDFLTKKEGPQAMLAAVADALAKHLHINWDLQVHVSARWPASTPNLESFLDQEPGGERSSDNSDEALDLLRMLFYACRQVTLDRQLWRRPDRLGFTVHAYTADGQEQQYFVTLGLTAGMQAERQAALQLGSTDAAPGVMHHVNAADTLHFSADCYEFPHQTLDLLPQFPDFWRANGARDCAALVERIADQALPRRHQPHYLLTAEATWHGLYAARLGLPTDAAEAADALQAQLARLGEAAANAAIATIRIGPDSLIFRTPRGREYAYALPFGPLRLAALTSAGGTMCGPTVGAIDLQTILVDAGKTPWLTDLGSAAIGPLVGDYAAVETALKIELCDDAITIDELFHLEQDLLDVARLSQRVDPGVAPAAKLVAAVTRLRHSAADAFGDQAAPYLLALYYHAAMRLLKYAPSVRYTKRELLAYLHAGICFGALGAILSPAARAEAPPANIIQGLHVDEARHEVRVDGRLVDLSPTQYSALLFLWQNADRVCTREAIGLAVYGAETLPDDKDAVGMLLSRLRAKIEPDPSNPKYIVTKRGSGMMLQRRSLAEM
jgi:DNA-binding response OmpR family regulator